MTQSKIFAAAVQDGAAKANKSSNSNCIAEKANEETSETVAKLVTIHDGKDIRQMSEKDIEALFECSVPESEISAKVTNLLESRLARMAYKTLKAEGFNCETITKAVTKAVSDKLNAESHKQAISEALPGVYKTLSRNYSVKLYVEAPEKAETCGTGRYEGVTYYEQAYSATDKSTLVALINSVNRVIEKAARQSEKRVNTIQNVKEKLQSMQLSDVEKAALREALGL